jgi:hypothetical protein
MAAGTVVEKAHPLLQAEALGRTLADIGSNGAPAALVQVIRWLDSFQFEEVPSPIFSAWSPRRGGPAPSWHA